MTTKCKKGEIGGDRGAKNESKQRGKRRMWLKAKRTKQTRGRRGERVENLKMDPTKFNPSIVLSSRRFESEGTKVCFDFVSCLRKRKEGKYVHLG